MRHATPLLVKFFSTFLLIWLSFRMLGEGELRTPLVAALLFTPLAYVLADRHLFAARGDPAASVAEGAGAGFLTWAVAAWLQAPVGAVTLLVASSAVAVAEYVFHIFIFREGVVEMGAPERAVDRADESNVREE